MYSAWTLSQALLLPNWIAGPAALVGCGTLFAFRVRREEQMMRDAFGEDYAECAAGPSASFRECFRTNLLDHFVGGRRQRLRDGDAERRG